MLCAEVKNLGGDELEEGRVGSWSQAHSWLPRGLSGDLSSQSDVGGGAAEGRSG